MRRTRKSLERKLLSLRGETDTPAARVFEEKCRSWLAQGKNKDGRGIKREAIKNAHHACDWFKAAQKYQEHEDSSIRRMARKTAKSVLHHEFPEIRKKLRKLHGQASKAGKRIADQRRKAAERIVGIDDRYDLQQLRSMSSVRQVGHALRNCTARNDWARMYVKDVDNGEAEMWVLRKKKRPLCLMTVNTETRTIDQIEGEDGSTPKLKRSVVCTIVNKLNIDGDDEVPFVKVGAFQAFRNGRPDVAPLLIEGRPYWVWNMRSGSEIIVATRKRPKGRKRWSRFTRDHTREFGTRRRRRLQSRSESDGSRIVAGSWNYLSEGDLLRLVLDHPPLAQKLREGTTLDSSRSFIREETTAGSSENEPGGSGHG
jgi:hypothetical protein